MVRLTTQDLVVCPTVGSMPGQTDRKNDSQPAAEWLGQSPKGWRPTSLSHFWLAITWLIKN